MVYEFILVWRIGSNRRGAVEFELKKPGFTSLQIVAEIQKMMTEIQCELEHFI